MEISPALGESDRRATPETFQTELPISQTLFPKASRESLWDIHQPKEEKQTLCPRGHLTGAIPSFHGAPVTSVSPREPHHDLQHFAIAHSGHHDAEGVLLQLHLVVEAGGRGPRERLHVLVRDLESLSLGVSDLHIFTQHKCWAVTN